MEYSELLREHPDYLVLSELNRKYRLTVEGGSEYIETYLQQFSARETATEFEARKTSSYIPAHAKAVLLEVKNSIYQRMRDIQRVGGHRSYREAITGNSLGVDLKSSTMNAFIGRDVLPELLMQGKVGVFVDRPSLPNDATLDQTQGLNPYLYVYKTEDILNWSYSISNRLTVLFLRDNTYSYNELGLVVDTEQKYRLLWLSAGKVNVQYFDKDKKPEGGVIVLNLPEIPFILFELSQSLLTDIADYQIALLNLGSSDMNYVLRSNFPFYTEQFNPSATDYLRPAGTEGTAAENTAKQKTVTVGVATGRQYPKGLERPDFIHPSSEPIMASMAKQNDLKAEIRVLVNLALTDLKSRSAAAKDKDSEGLESGLSNIGLELETGERSIARVWSHYVGHKSDVIITYPSNYSLKTDGQRREEAKELTELCPTVPSVKFQKTVKKEIANILLGNKVSSGDLQTMYSEIDSAVALTTDPKIIIADHEAGLVSTETASGLRGYPKGEVDQAKKDHAERAARIALAQSSAASRGVADIGMDNPSDEKAASRQTDMDTIVEDKTRGTAR